MDGIPHLTYSGSVYYTGHMENISGMYASIFRCFASPLFLNHHIFIILILAFQLWLMHAKLQTNIPNISKYHRLLLDCVNSLWTINLEIRYLLYGMPIQKVHVKPRLDQPIYRYS